MSTNDGDSVLKDNYPLLSGLNMSLIWFHGL